MKIEYFLIFWAEVFVVINELSEDLSRMDNLGNGSVWHCGKRDTENIDISIKKFLNATRKP